MINILKKFLVIMFSSFFLLLSENVNCASLKDVATMEIKTSFVENYMWRGFDLLPNNDSAFQPDLYLEFKNLGLYIGVWGSFAFDERWDIWDELDYYIGMLKSFNEESRFTTDIEFIYTYFDYPNQNKYINTQEVAFGIKLPNLFSINDIKIKLFSTLYYSFPVHENEIEQKGYWLKIGANGDIPFTIFHSDNINLLIETFINDGGASMGVEEGFSHIHFMITVPYNFKGFTIKPSIHYQYTIEESVNSENEFWSEISIAKTLF